MTATIAVLAVALGLTLHSHGESLLRGAVALPEIHSGHLILALTALDCHPATPLLPDHIHDGEYIPCARLSVDDRRALWVSEAVATPIHSELDGVLFVLRVTLGGSGSWARLVWVTGGEAHVHQFDDEREIGAVSWPPDADGGITVPMLVHGPDDPMSDPTVPATLNVTLTPTGIVAH